LAEVAGVCPAFAEITVDVAMGTIMSRPGLDLATRELILVAACVMLGHAMPQLRAMPKPH
jgi:4-carboxymuconolactone decarboxylase